LKNFRGVMLKLNDVTWLYQHLPMRFTLSVAR
jgi:thiamine transport system ATP-binding protein